MPTADNYERMVAAGAIIPPSKRNILERGANGDFAAYSKLQETRDAGRENPPFKYPGNRIHNINGQSTKLVRGFMRSILLDKDIYSKLGNRGLTTPGNLRLNFQFNPEYIERSVSQSPGAINPLLQDPANLTAAVPGTATFGFTMTFNRENEVSANRVLGGRDKQVKFMWEGNDLSEGDFSKIKRPEIVGVMADLYIFDQIIGQGITPELVDLITLYTQQQVIAKNNAGADQEDFEATQFNESALRESIVTNANFGNFAFLNPMPVRVVFSDLFMVEGLVTSSAVAFQKFSYDMVPTICQVNVNLQALYVGFAQKKAFLTNELANWASDTAKASETQNEEASGAQKQLNAAYKSGVVYFNWGATIDRLKDGKVDEDGSAKELSVFNHTFNSNEYRIPGASGSGTSYYPGNSANVNDRFVTVPQLYNVGNTDTYINGSRVYNVEDAFQKSSRLLMPTVMELDFSGILGGTEVATIKPTSFNTNFEIVYEYKLTPTSTSFGGKATAKIPVQTIDASPWVQDANNPKKWYGLLYLDWDNINFDKGLPNRIANTANTGYILSDTLGSLHIRVSFTVKASVSTSKGTVEVTSREFSSIIPFKWNTPLYGYYDRIKHVLSKTSDGKVQPGKGSSMRRNM